jgi:ABC-type multidrug transport system fused ATPase/permease subunit
LGFEQPLTGQVIIDGQDTCDLQHESLRRQIGTVLQDTRLVGNSLMEVIAAGRPLSVEEAWKAAEDAGLSDDLQALPMGLQTLVPAGGSNLSGGQRQRLAIARTLLADPQILILDDATSAIDVAVEERIHAALDARRADRTTILIAHRLSTIALADRVILLDNGAVAATGTHEELLVTNVRYAAILADTVGENTEQGDA